MTFDFTFLSVKEGLQQQKLWLPTGLPISAPYLDRKAVFAFPQQNYYCVLTNCLSLSTNINENFDAVVRLLTSSMLRK